MIKTRSIEKILLCVILIMQLGFHTNTGYDDQLSLITTCVMAFILFSIGNKRWKVSFSNRIKDILVWYSLFVVLCAASFLWAAYSNKYMIKDLLVGTVVPYYITVVCIARFLKNNTNGEELLTLLVDAEVIVAIRAIANTPVLEMINGFNSRLYGTGLGVNYNHFTTQFSLIFIAAVYLTMRYNKRYVIPASFIGINIILSGSRKAILVSILATVVMYLVLTDKKRISAVLFKAVIVVLAISGIIYLLVTNPFLYNLVGKKTLTVVASVINIENLSLLTNNIDSSSITRAELRSRAVEIFMQSPIIGVGYYCFPKYNSYGLYAHNNYLEILADLGIVGLIMYYWIYIKNIILNFKNCVRKQFEMSKCDRNLFALIFFLSMMVIEYGQITYYRLYALVPLTIVICSTDIKSKYNKEVIN